MYRDRTWRRLPSDAAITVHAPGGNGAEGRRVHAVVMGQSGLVQGLAVYEDDVALGIDRLAHRDRVDVTRRLATGLGMLTMRARGEETARPRQPRSCPNGSTSTVAGGSAASSVRP